MKTDSQILMKIYYYTLPESFMAFFNSVFCRFFFTLNPTILLINSRYATRQIDK